MRLRISRLELLASALDHRRTAMITHRCMSCFQNPREIETLESQAGLKIRKDCQFHWHNREAIGNFEEFLADVQFSKAKKSSPRSP